ncbi:RNase H-like domain-containing protein, partial [Bacteroides uniformis]|uniref:RNase H-like domain-containing protein n=1 Tax=Bacteroides uniformis TaxID=820 RepID=UPI001AA0DB1B
FKLIKQSIVNSPFLTTPNFLNPFTLYTFPSDPSYAVFLTLLNDQQTEATISFFSSSLQGAKMNYTSVEKQA